MPIRWPGGHVLSSVLPTHASVNSQNPAADIAPWFNWRTAFARSELHEPRSWTQRVETTIRNKSYPQSSHAPCTNRCSVHGQQSTYDQSTNNSLLATSEQTRVLLQIATNTEPANSIVSARACCLRPSTDPLDSAAGYQNPSATNMERDLLEAEEEAYPSLSSVPLQSYMKYICCG